MPRYCAVKVCRNRGGTPSKQDNKRISFYPFPLQDKSRLQKWVDNMKREEWTPSRHQYLCSEHFTDDCFDIRWGIRYLKNTAIPTIFPSAEDDGEKKIPTIKRSSKAKPRILDTDIESTGFDSPLSKKPLILTRTCEKVQSGVKTAACDGVKPTASCRTLSHCIKPHAEDQADSIVTVLCCESLGPFSDGEEKIDALQAVLGQAFSFVPVETVKDEAFFSEESERPCERQHISIYEHSYCRSDTDEDQLWRKLLSLHAKILELDRREESTVAKIRALEMEVAHLKRDGAVFKEKQKILEDYMSSIVV